VGIGHTRWATHGQPNDVNAHPHYSQSGRIAIIHNGIIENYSALKQELSNKGHRFLSETDSEVLVHFIEDVQKHSNCSLEEAIRLALQQVVGAYAIVVISKDHPDTLFAARKGSPLVIGVGKGEHFLASDATPIIEYTNDVIYLDDLEIAVITRESVNIKNLEDVRTTPYIHTLEMELEAIEKGGYDHFMLKEIFEQPRSVGDSMRGRISATKGHLLLGGLREYLNKLVNAKRVVILGCGTSWHAGLVAEYVFEEFARIPVEVEYASEFRYRNPIINEATW
jgi:glucosamine--fructose-6-phosphate aminotransferase (isomerizing)